MLILSGMQSTKANAADSPHSYMPPRGYETPGASTCFDSGEMKDLANYKKSCDLVKVNLIDTEKTLSECVNSEPCVGKWWADPQFVVGGFALSFTVGIIAGMLVK